MEASGVSSGKGVDRPATAEADAVVRTFLIADVRGYTSFTQARGDEEAGRLASRFAELARDGVAAGGGDVLELRGDEALCVFPSARQALRGAVELQRHFRARKDGQPVFPLGIGIGLAAGEAVPVEGGYRGGALNLAARLCSLAGPGQILASDMVTGLAGTVEGIRFVERREVRLKGLDRPMRAVEILPEIELPPLPETRRPSRRRRRGLLLMTAGVLVATVAVTAGVVALTRDSKQTIVVAPNSVAVIDPATSRIVDAIPVGESPGPIAAGRNTLWVVNLNERTLIKIDPAARSVDARIGLPTPTDGPSLRLAVAPNNVWVFACHLELFRIDPERTQIVQELEVFRNVGRFFDLSCAVAADAASVWVPIDFPSRLVRVASPRSGPASIAERIPLPSGIHTAITVGAGSVWIADREGDVVRRMEPAGGAVIKTISMTDGARAMVFGHGAVWIANDTEDSVLRLRPRTNSIVRAISVGRDPVALAVGPDAIWVANSGDGTVSRIDPVSNTVTDTIRVGHRPLGVAIAGGLVWVTVRA